MTAAPVAAKTRAVPISATAVTHENHVTPAPSAGLMKVSLNGPYVGSRCAALNPTALASPSAIAACGTQRFFSSTKITVTTAATI
jgi:hypothetical protein